MNELQFILDGTDCKILCINEHWLESNNLELSVPKGYELASSFCRNTKKHGGVVIFTKLDANLNLRYNVIDITHLCEETIFEAAAIHLPLQKTIIVSVYRTPSSNEELFTMKLKKLILLLIKYKNHSIYILGDINIDINLGQKTSVNFLLNILRSYDFYCLNKKATRLNSCLDNIISNVHQTRVKFDVIDLCLSDHEGLWLKLDTGLVEAKNSPKE